MSRIIGKPAEEDLIGTDRADLILGRGGPDLIKGNGGNDRLSGYGEVYGDGGRDKYYAVAVDQQSRDDVELQATSINLGVGNDFVLLNTHNRANGNTLPIDKQGLGLRYNVALGDGNDRGVVSGEIGSVDFTAGEGRDSFWVANTGVTGVWLGDGLFHDDSRDIIHTDGESYLNLFDFGPNDKLIIYDSDLTVDDIRLRTVFTHSTKEDDIRITLPSSVEIFISKNWEGYLNADQVEIRSEPLQVRSKVLVGHEKKMSDTVFGSAADEKVVAKGKDLFLGRGDDVGIGSGKKDRMFGEGGDDVLKGKGGRDVLDGGAMDDRLIGGNGNDKLLSGRGDDVMIAGRGNDKLIVEDGVARAMGGGGKDTFIFDNLRPQWDGEATVSGGAGRDKYKFLDGYGNEVVVVRDFAAGREKMDFRKASQYEVDEDDIARIMADLKDVSGSDTALGVEGVRVKALGWTVYLEGLSVDQIDLDNFLF